MTRTLSVAFIFALAWTGSCAAGPVLRAEITVQGDKVTIGDMVEDAGSNAVVPIFRAPDIGTAGAVPVVRILEILKKNGMNDVDSQGLSEVLVTRASRIIPLAEMEERIATRIAQDTGVSDPTRIAIGFDKGLRSIHVEPDSRASLVLTRFSFEPVTGRFNAEFDVPGSNIVRAMRGVRLSGQAQETYEVVVAARQLTRGDVFKAPDLTLEKRVRREGEVLPKDMILTLGETAGKAAKRAIPAGRPLRADDLMKPEIVDKGAAVLISYELPGMALAVAGKAMEAGALGDTIEVQNMQSKKSIQAIIVAPNRVVVPSLARAAALASAAAAAAIQ
jgi:flagella basal body P-ring formation protein FlgA